jgi:hypothetical protein
MPWVISGNVGAFARTGVDANGWLWEIERDGDARRVLVEISGTAWAVREETLPEDTRDAIRTEGRAEVDKVLNLEEPPRVIACGTTGCYAVPLERQAATG